MNVTRIAILAVAAIAAGAAALLVRGMLGGGTPAVQASLPPPAIVTTEVLVAAKEVPPGQALDAASVRWEAWPRSSIAASFITKDAQPDVAKVVEGVVVRSPLVAGQPITDASIVHTNSAGFLAATVAPGMRAVAIPVSADSGAGGFILPNDRVDVILTHDVSGGEGQKDFQSETILRNVRFLAIDQTSKPVKDGDSIVGKTATLELSENMAEVINQGRAQGTLSLALRSLADSKEPAKAVEVSNGRRGATGVLVGRYGITKPLTSTPGGFFR
jgi:pilus assembly protein CpaB